MRIKSLSTILKKAELQVQEEYLQRESIINHITPKKETDVMDEFDAINLNNIDVDDDPQSFQEGDINHQLNYWDCMMPWDGYCTNDQEAGDGYQANYLENEKSRCMVEDKRRLSIKKGAEFAVLEDDDKKLSLNLSLNYQEVLDAWSDRRLWADDSSFLTANNAYMGEVPVIAGGRKRREASVLRYKEKRQTRLFSKKIRYQVRKLNADKRPRLKGRFVKRISEKILK